MKYAFPFRRAAASRYGSPRMTDPSLLHMYCSAPDSHACVCSCLSVITKSEGGRALLRVRRRALSAVQHGAFYDHFAAISVSSNQRLPLIRRVHPEPPRRLWFTPQACRTCLYCRRRPPSAPLLMCGAKERAIAWPSSHHSTVVLLSRLESRSPSQLLRACRALLVLFVMCSSSGQLKARIGAD